MQQLSVWVGAGLVSAGVSAALIAGAGAASAATGSESDPGGGGATSSGSKSPDAGKPASGTAAKHRRPDARPNTHRKAESASDGAANGKNVAASSDTDTDTDTPKSRLRARHAMGERTPRHAKPATDTENRKATASTATDAPPAGLSTEATRASDASDALDVVATHFRSVPSAVNSALTARPVIDSVVKSIAAQDVSARFTPPRIVQARVAADVTPAAPSALGVIEGLIGSVVADVGSAAFNALQSVETVVTGPPKVPPGSHVTVQSSTIQLDNGETVPADWYFPKTTDGKPPKQMILLQHGFLAQGPMYSYTAAALAEQTGSIVVAPTLSSNPFAGDDYWLGGTGMAESIGHLFEGDRTALTKSARDAGYETAYGLPEGTGELPQKFALEGHSLGANLVSGAAGTLAADCNPGDCAADDLVGVILLDGVPMGNTLPNALAEMDAKEALTGYIPVREIGAPLNLWNSLSSVNGQLTEARPNRFNGVVLDGGVHSDAMSGGNPLIQLALYVAAGFPELQNPPAVEALSAEWLNDWFAGDTDNGDGLDPGTTVDIPTPKGTAHGVVIGTPEPLLLALFHAIVTTLEGSTATSIPAVNPTLAMLAA